MIAATVAACGRCARRDCTRGIVGAAKIRAALERYDGIGVRIEDDVLITRGEVEAMSAPARSARDIEALMAGGKKKQQTRAASSRRSGRCGPIASRAEQWPRCALRARRSRGGFEGEPSEQAARDERAHLRKRSKRARETCERVHAEIIRYCGLKVPLYS